MHGLKIGSTTDVMVIIRRRKSELIGFGMYYGFIALLPIFLIAALLASAIHSSGTPVGVSAVTLASLLMVYLPIKTATCRVEVNGDGTIVIINPIRRRSLTAPEINGLAIRWIARDRVVRLKLREVRHVTALAIGPSELDAFRQAILAWSTPELDAKSFIRRWWQ